MNRPLLAVLSIAFATALLSGCISDTSGPAADADDPGTAGAPRGSEAGSPSSHGTPQRADGPVEVRSEGGQFVARRTVTVVNDFGGAAESALTLKAFNGGVAVQASDNGGYQFRAELYGRGATEDQAREALGALRLDATDSLSGGRLTLGFTLTSGDLPVALPLVSGNANNGGGFALFVPPQPGHEVTAESSNGGVSVEGLHGPSLTVDTSNAGVHVAGAFGAVDLDTSNGGIDLDGTFHDVKADTSNAAVHADLSPARSGRFEAKTTNGGIAVEVPASGAAYDVTGDTSNANVVIRLDGSRIQSEEHATYRSPDFASAPVQVTIVLSSSNAGISVED